MQTSNSIDGVLKQLEDSSGWIWHFEANKTQLRHVIKRLFGESSEYWHEFQSIKGGWENDATRDKLIGIVKAIRADLIISSTPQKTLDVSTAPPLENPVSGTNLQRVFVVHGHDGEMKQAVARSLERLGLIALIPLQIQKTDVPGKNQVRFSWGFRQEFPEK